MSTHTPGPWRTAEDQGESFIWHDTANCRINIASARDKANAALIAAAPDMLAALKTTKRALLVAQLDEPLTFETCAEILDAVRAAIAKAEGVS